VKSKYKPPPEKRPLLTWAIVLFIISRVLIYFVLEPLYSDTRTYFNFAAQAFAQHKSVFTDLRIGYPPIAWWVMAFPWFFSQNSSGAYALSNYAGVFRGFMLLCDVASFFLLVAFVRKQSPGREGRAAFLYVICTAILGHLLFDRFDTLLLLLLLLPAYLWQQSYKGKRKNLRFWASFTIGLGICFKVIPIMMVPFIFIAELSVATVVGLFIGTVAPFLIQYLVSGPDVFDLFRHHAGRGIQLESLYATFMAMASFFGIPVNVVNAAGAFDLEGSLTRSMQLLSKLLLICWLSLFALWAFIKRDSLQKEKIFLAGFLAIAMSVILSPVLSPQYFVWALSLLIIMDADLFQSGDRATWISATALISTAVLTTWVFPYHYFTTEAVVGLIPAAGEGEPVVRSFPYFLLGLRNFAYLALTVWISVRYFIFYFESVPGSGARGRG
jgi:hypothetical protein